MYELTIPLELFLVGGLMLVAAIMEWQLILDRLHHGTTIKPYDWELEN